MALLQGLQNAVDKGRARRQLRQQGLSGQAMAAPKVPLQQGAPTSQMNSDLMGQHAQAMMGLQSAQATAQQGVGQRMAQGASQPMNPQMGRDLAMQNAQTRLGMQGMQGQMQQALQGMAGPGALGTILNRRRNSYAPPGKGISAMAMKG